MTALLVDPAGPAFELTPQHEATEPPEARGLARDNVRLLASWRSTERLQHARFCDLGRFLVPGDLLVVNTSATVPAAVAATGPDGTPLVLHLSTQLPGGLELVELRQGGRPYRLGRVGATIRLAGRASADLMAPYGEGGRLWIAALHLPAGRAGERARLTWLARQGRPIRYRHVPGEWPLSCYQTIFANQAGSAEMPSAARPFTAELVASLVAAGVGVSPLILHTGVSSQESHELPYPEWFRVAVTTADRVNDTHRRGGRVIAVGTTVVRALETVVDGRGRVHPGEGWTETVVTPERGVRAVDGLITGWHEPAASHLAMLEAIAGPSLLRTSYQAALADGYLWHEFGDSHLILP
jgi:S-adenosylmethionine:tRNA ribosyltransferase-isomerase